MFSACLNTSRTFIDGATAFAKSSINSWVAIIFSNCVANVWKLVFVAVDATCFEGGGGADDVDVDVGVDSDVEAKPWANILAAFSCDWA